MPTTLALATAASVLGLALALVVAIVSASRPYGWLDHVLTSGALFGMSLPSFWFALILVFLFADTLKWLPATGIRPATSQVWSLREMLPHLVMPVAVTALVVVPTMARYARSALLEVLAQDFIRVARSKGLAGRAVLLRHALRNALIPVVTVLGLIVPNLLGGSVVVETVFALPGVGRLAVEAALTRDYPAVITVTMFSATTVVLVNLVVDFLYTLVDPRIKLEAH
jgi:peptide/nickel transport system permease protein